MKIVYIHENNKAKTGAHYINQLIVDNLKKAGIDVKSVYPKLNLIDPPLQLKGMSSILFFYSLLEQKREILKYDLIQGTTFTPLPFLAYDVPVVVHFGSTNKGFLKSTPRVKNISHETQHVWYKLKSDKVVRDLDLRTRKPLKDIADMEIYAADRATAVIATSQLVKDELVRAGVFEGKVYVIHNAIEDYWFNEGLSEDLSEMHLLFLGRLGNDVFYQKLKGLDRLIDLYSKFPNVKKLTIGSTTNTKIPEWMDKNIPNHQFFLNTPKIEIPKILKSLRGSIFLLTSRYEGFSLSLIESMSQGIIPIAYPVGVVPEIIEHGKNGFIVHSQREVVRCIKKIMKDPWLRKTLSEQARQTSLQFKPEILSKRLIKLYRQLVFGRTFASGSQKMPSLVKL